MRIDKYLTIKEASAFIGVTPNTLRNWEEEGKVKVHRNPRNRYRLYRIEDLKVILNDILESKSLQEKHEYATRIAKDINSFSMENSVNRIEILQEFHYLMDGFGVELQNDWFAKKVVEEIKSEGARILGIGDWELFDQHVRRSRMTLGDMFHSIFGDVELLKDIIESDPGEELLKELKDE